MKYESAPLRKPSLQEIARALGGEISGGQVIAPGPGHSPQDRSLSVKVSNSDPGYVVHSFAGDDPIKCKDHVRERLGMPAWEPSRGNGHDHDPVVAELHLLQGGRHTTLARAADGGQEILAAAIQWHRLGEWRTEGAHSLSLARVARGRSPIPSISLKARRTPTGSASLGFVATTSSGGSNGKWTPELSEPFAGRTVYIIPDNDEPGHKYAQRVAQHLHGIAAKVAIVELPGLGPRTADQRPRCF